MVAQQQTTNPWDDPAWLAMQVSTDTTRSTVRLTGELDLATAPRLGETLGQLQGDGYCDIALDLSELKFLSAAGLKVFRAVDRALRARGGRLTLIRAGTATRRIIIVSGLGELLVAA